MPRVGILALLQESNTFLSRQTTFDDFQEEVLAFGDDVRRCLKTPRTKSAVSWKV